MERLIIYGDIHGCLDEFKKLRQKIAINPFDIEVCVGDFTTKGTVGKNCTRYLRKNSILSVIGNNEITLLKRIKNLGREFFRLSKKDINYISSLPYYLKFENITVIHAGISSNIWLNNLSPTDKETITTIRNIKDSKNNEIFWSDYYDGSDGFLIYGHTVFKEPKIQNNSIGIDTGCVYGNKLTAIVFEKSNDLYDFQNFKLFFELAQKKYIRK